MSDCSFVLHGAGGRLSNVPGQVGGHKPSWGSETSAFQSVLPHFGRRSSASNAWPTRRRSADGSRRTSGGDVPQQKVRGSPLLSPQPSSTWRSGTTAAAAAAPRMVRASSCHCMSNSAFRYITQGCLLRADDSFIIYTH